MTTKELLALVGKATPGPWLDGAGFVYAANAEGTNRFWCRIERGWASEGHVRIDDEELEANAALIVAAVNALPALCAEVEALKKVVDAARAVAAIGFHGTAVDALDAALDVIDAAKEPK